jgi:hypothetical protein
METSTWAAIISVAGAIVTASMTAFAGLLSARQKRRDEALAAERQANTDREFAELRAKMDRQFAAYQARLADPTRFAAERLLRQFFDDPKFPSRLRSFQRIKKYLGGTFSDEEVRKLLINIGASERTLTGGREGWRLPISTEEEE